MTNSRWQPWRHLVLLVLLGALFVYLADLLTGAQSRVGGWSGAPTEALRSLPEALYPMFALAAAIAVGTLRPYARRVREAIGIVVVVTLAMALLDLISPSSGDVSAFRTISLLSRGTLGDFSMVARSYTLDHPRYIALVATQRGAMLLLPAILVGLVLGLGAWVHARVQFRSSRDAAVARWVLAWVLSIGAIALIMSWSSGYSYEILSLGKPIWLTFVPYIPAGAVSAVGWRAAAHAQEPDMPDGMFLRNETLRD